MAPIGEEEQDVMLPSWGAGPQQWEGTPGKGMRGIDDGDLPSHQV
jgi:hypothetical protein